MLFVNFHGSLCISNYDMCSSRRQLDFQSDKRSGEKKERAGRGMFFLFFLSTSADCWVFGVHG